MPCKSIEIETTELCHICCNRVAKFKTKSGNLICERFAAQCPEARKKNSEGAKRTYKGEKPRSKFFSTEKGKNCSKKGRDKYIENRHFLSLDPESNIKNLRYWLLVEREHKCEKCLNEKWFEEPIVLEVDHVDGNRKNNSRENLKLLCPNCHSQTPNWRGRNINSGKNKIDDEILLKLIMEGKNNRQILLHVGLTPKGGNYARLNKLRYQ